MSDTGKEIDINQVINSRLETDQLLNELKQPEQDFSIDRDGNTYRTYSEVLKNYFPGSLDLDGKQTLRLHSEFLMQATDRVRGLIHSGVLGNLKSSEAFKVIAKIHQGRNPLEHVVAYWDPTVMPDDLKGYPLILPLSYEAVDMGILDTTTRDTRGFGYDNFRGREMFMSRGGVVG